MKNKKIKQYLLTTIIQLLTVTIHTVCSYYALKFECVALAPVKYILPMGAGLLCIDGICELIIFRVLFNRDNPEVARDE